MIILIAGVYGVGKSTVCRKLSDEMQLNFYSASELIKKEKGSSNWDKSKKTDQIGNNQEFLMTAIKKIACKDFLLDGHFCVINKQGHIENIDLSSIKKISIGAVLLLKEDPEIIALRLLNRDEVAWEINLISELQENEITQAKKFANENSISLAIVDAKNFFDIKKNIIAFFSSKGK
ncbi:ATP-binding protein [Pantoea ananatis]|uniref:ATP-binding protein n=1 Tax=Pantoea ananas TaxID=553 RepID=UPI0020269F5F|nr:ATP-binding protein [Pantoea ananatis]URL15701.1 ATP-binding protein [Pantoea ananatis]